MFTITATAGKIKALIFPPDDPRQALRIKLLLITCAIYYAALIPILCVLHFELQPPIVLPLYLSLSTGATALQYAIFRLRLNLRFQDRSLSLLQMTLALVVVLTCQVFAGESRAFWILSLMMVFVHGCFKVPLPQLQLLTILTLSAYALTIPLARHFEGTHYRLHYELMLWLNFAFFLPALIWAAGQFGALQKRLAQSNHELQTLLNEASYAASHDGLTGLYNRGYAVDALQRALIESPKTPCCACLFDLDRFKQINDLNGHDGGDIIIKGFADTASGALRPGDVIARYGGEEFLLVMPNTTLAQAVARAERVRTRFAEIVFTIDVHEVTTTVSAGVAEHHGGESVSDLLRRTDRALYRAKHLGRDRTEAS